MKKRLLSAALALAMLLGTVPAPAFAQGTDVAGAEQEQCSCSIRCTADGINADCPVCAADPSACAAAPEATATPEPEATQEPEATPEPTEEPKATATPEPEAPEATATPEPTEAPACWRSTTG